MKQFFLTSEKFGSTLTWWVYVFNLNTHKYDRLTSTKHKDPITAFWEVVPDIEEYFGIKIMDFKPSYILF